MRFLKRLLAGVDVRQFGGIQHLREVRVGLLACDFRRVGDDFSEHTPERPNHHVIGEHAGEDHDGQNTQGGE